MATHVLRDIPGEHHRPVPPFAVRLHDRVCAPLSLYSESGRAVATLRSAGLNRRAVVNWLDRHQVPILVDLAVKPDASSPVPLLPLPTIVVCADSRIRDLAALYAQSVEAPLHVAESPDAVLAAIEKSPPHDSVTVFLLNDRFDESLCHAMAVAAGRNPGLSYGFMSAFTPDHLAWLVVKSWALFLRPFPESVSFADWSFSNPHATTRVRSVPSGATRHEPAGAPWVADSTTMLSLRAHGAPFDASMGRVVVCGHLDPALPGERTLRAPSCFHDHVCFRMNAKDGPTERLKAVDASPLVWCLDSCASLPLTGNAFGNGTSYVFGLIAGAAAGVVGPFLDLTTSGAMSRHCEAVLATGGTLGELAVAASRLEPGRGFDKYLLIGSPDLRLLPARRLEGRRDAARVLYRLRGERQHAWRLAVPSDLTPPVYVVGDDGNAHWATAQCHWFEHGANRDLIVTLEEPTDVDGWLLAGSARAGSEELVRTAGQIEDNLEVLEVYPFVDVKSDAATRCRHLARGLRDIASAPGRLRCRVDATVVLGNLMVALDTLHRLIARGFLDAVALHDVNLDRMASHGFHLSPTERSSERCPTCGLMLYVTETRWHRKPSYVRRWVQCANCSGLSITPEDGPLEILPPIATRNADGLSVSVQIRNMTDLPMEAMIAGLPRQGNPEEAVGPLSVILPPGEVKSLRFNTPLNLAAAGVISYRLLVLCRAGVAMLALKHLVTPVGVAVSSVDTAHTAAGGLSKPSAISMVSRT